MADSIGSIPAGFEAEPQSMPTAAPEASASPSMAGSELPPGFEPEQSNEEKYAGPLNTVAAFSQGAATGLIGPVAPWIAKKLGATDEQLTGLSAAHPIAYGAGEFAGLGVGLATGTGVGGLAVKAGEAIPAIAESAPYLAKVGNSVLKQAAEMTILGSSDEATKMLLDPNRSAETALSGVGLSALTGAGIGGVMTGAINPLWKATLGGKLTNVLSNIALDSAKGIADVAESKTVPTLLKKTLATFGGVSEQDIDAYVNHHKAVQDIPEFEEIYGHALDHIGNIGDQVQAGKMSVAEAKGAYKDLQDKYEQNLKEAGADAKTAHDLAKTALKDGQTKLQSDLLSNAINAGDKAAAASEALRTKIVNGSAKSYDILDKSEAVIPMKGFYNKAEELAKDLEGEGTLEAQGQAERIRQYAAGLIESHGSEVEGAQAKALIQGLDKISKYDFNASQFDKGLSSAYKQLRYDLDNTLKDAVLEYAKAMKPLAEDTKLLAQLRRYGTPESAATRIKSLKNADAYKNEMPLLRQLESRTGAKFTHDIEPYANADMRAKLYRALPEQEAANATAEALETLKHPRTKQAMQDALLKSEEAKSLETAQAQLEQAKAAQSEVKGVTPATLQGKLSSVARPGKSIANEEALNKIPGMQGKSIPELMNLLRIRDAFSKNATRGSKHVNLYGMIAGALGSVAGHGLPGIGVGSVAGAYIDNNGPTLVKQVLDKYLQHYGDVVSMSSESKLGAAKAMLTKILGHEGAASGEGFKAGVDYIAAVKRGESVLSQAAKGLFASDSPVLQSNQLPTVADRAKIDKMIAKNEKNPNENMHLVNSPLGHYLGDHNAALATAITSQLSYLQSLKPSSHQLSPLDSKLPPSPAQEARYNRAKDIAIQPNIVLQHIKDGTWQASDFVDLRNMNPAFYKQMQSKVIGEMSNAMTDERPIPYRIRIGLSAFVNQPLDSTMAPMSIQAAQPKPQQAPPQGQQAPKGHKSSNSLNKMSGNYKTPGQAAESDRANRD